MQKILFYWNELKSTFWFIPILIILFSISLALGFIYLDSRFEMGQDGMGRYLFIGSADSARSILTTVSGAMIGVAGTVFSITLVALTLASSQFGSRLVKNFMYDRLNQVVLGSYIATYIYCLVVLNSIKENGEIIFIPSLSVLLALLVALANIILLIIFIHHIAVSIQAEKVISDISELLSKNIRSLFPEKMGEEDEEVEEKDISSIKSDFKIKSGIKANKSGYLQYLDGQSLINLVTGSGGFLELYHRPGDYLVEGVDIATLYTHKAPEDNDLNTYKEQFFTGKTRTQQQDAEHSIHQMVEIAVRALSPGVNDPYTAIACIDNLTAAMSYLATVKFPSKYRYDETKTLRIITDTLTYEGMLDAAFNQIRQFSKGSPAVVIRLMESLSTINKFTQSKMQKEAIKKHAKMALNMARNSFDEPNDLKDLEERSKELLQ